MRLIFWHNNEVIYFHYHIGDIRVGSKIENYVVEDIMIRVELNIVIVYLEKI